MKLVFFVAFTLSISAISVYGEEKANSSVEEFLKKSRGGTMLCAWSWFPRGEKWIQREKFEEKIQTCQASQLVLVEPFFEKAIDSVKNKPAAAESLKVYYAGWISLMSGMTLHPYVQESRDAYTERQMAIDDHLEKMAIRVKIDAKY
jgi:hypothetical protein